jgi:hypothetical protein
LIELAERVGFEPTVVLPTHAFQACALNHSAISPAVYSQALKDDLKFAGAVCKFNSLCAIGLLFLTNTRSGQADSAVAQDHQPDGCATNLSWIMCAHRRSGTSR